MIEAALYRILGNEKIRAAVSFLVGRVEPIQASYVATFVDVLSAEVFELLSELIQEKYVVVNLLENAPEDKLLQLTQDTSALSALATALHQVELRSVAQRAATFNFDAASKLLAIDDLAESVMIARQQVRKNANLC